jgi:hypothetical protein
MSGTTPIKDVMTLLEGGLDPWEIDQGLSRVRLEETVKSYPGETQLKLLIVGFLTASAAMAATLRDFYPNGWEGVKQAVAQMDQEMIKKYPEWERRP